MKITIDEKQCIKKNLTLPEALMAVIVRINNNEYTIDNLISSLEKKEAIVYDKDSQDFYITRSWSDKLDEILCDSTKDIDADEEQRLMILAKKMRDCYPKGKMPGTPYYYACNNREVFLKMKKFFVQYGDYSDEDIVDATKRYVDSFCGNYKGMRLIKYFIMKDDVKPCMDDDGNIVNKVVQTSDLATFLENKDFDSVENDNWLMISRN